MTLVSVSLLLAQVTPAATEHVPLPTRLIGIVGMATMIGIAWLMSSARTKINWRLVGMGVALQVVFGVLVLKTGFGQWLFNGTNVVFKQLLDYTTEGAGFIFGALARSNFVPVGVPEGTPPAIAPGELWAQTGAQFAFNVLPTIIFFSSLMGVLYHLGVMQFIVRIIAMGMQRTMGTSGAETLSVAGNIFVGQTESPLMIRPFIDRMTESELNTVMMGGFATIAGGVMAAYVGMLSDSFPDIAGHLLTASVMNAPAALLISKIMVPETGTPATRGTVSLKVERTEANVVEAAAAGAGQGLTLALNVGAMLLAFIALIALLNGILGGVAGWMGFENVTIEGLLGVLLRPLAWVMGVNWGDAEVVGSLIGVKAVLNEFFAYAQLSGILGQDVLSDRSAIVASYALLGFANFSSIAIQIGGIGGIAPNRRGDLARLGIKAMIGGNLAAFMSASLAGMLIG